MEALFYFFAQLVAATLDVVSIAMFLRMIFSLFLGQEESRFSMLLACITEPFILPVRYFMVKFNILQDSPIDWSFTVSYLIIALLRLFLPII